MSHQDLSHIATGATLATKNTNRWLGPNSNVPLVTHRLLVVTRTTATLIEANHSAHSFKIRKKDGKLVGCDYDYAIEATPEMIAEHHAQIAMRNRYERAVTLCNSLIGKELHQLNLTTEQLEVLGQAWAKIKAMATP